MGDRRKLIVVSNRGPVSYARDESGARVARRGGGGLATALRNLLARHDVTWIASAMSDEDRAVAREHGGDAFVETSRDGSSYRLRLVEHDVDAYARFYTVAANPTLWFVQHSLWDLAYAPDFDDARHEAWSEGYVPVNEAFAAATVAELQREPDAAVLFQDYHLYLAPGMVRNAQPGVVSSHFVHVPWPDALAWSVLPDDIRRDVHAGLLANDVVGFHTQRWSRNFLRSCADVLGAEVDGDVVRHGGRGTLVTSHPIGIDADEFDALAGAADVLERERELVASRPELLVLRVDRTDPSKNIVRGFRAFGLFLERHPEMRGRVRMLALLDPSRQDIPEYADYVAAVEREARALGDAVELRIADDFAQSVAAYKQYDALLVNAVFDGLNLVSKEAPYVNARDGVLILSENAGSHEELGEWAVTVNPFDVSEQAEAIHAALTMDAGERRRRLDAIRAHVREHDLAEWGAAQLADLDGVRSRR
ncbi:MAG TPA: trehalose-6-phosphate synthase [Gaiellaceae bacterium]|nr:trehalose-6-phosphate synthase [Gaiellaceae bacterium]